MSNFDNFDIDQIPSKSTLSVVSAAKKFLFKLVLIILKMPGETFL